MEMLFVLEDSHSAGEVTFLGVFSSLQKAVQAAREAYNNGYTKSRDRKVRIDHLQLFAIIGMDYLSPLRELGYCLDCDGSQIFIGSEYPKSASKELVEATKGLGKDFING